MIRRAAIYFGLNIVSADSYLAVSRQTCTNIVDYGEERRIAYAE